MSAPGPIEQFRHSVRHGLWLVVAVSIATNLLLLALPIYSLQIFDRVLLSRSMDTLWVLTLAVVLALLASVVLEALRGQVLLRVSNRLALGFERRLFDEILLRASRVADRSLQPLRDLATVRGFATAPQGLVAIADAPFALVFLGVVYWIHPWMGHAMVLGMALLLLITWGNERMVAPRTRAAAAAALEAQKRIDGLAHAADVVAAHGSGEAAWRHWNGAQLPSLGEASQAATVAGVLAGLAKGVRLLLNVALTCLGAYLAARDELTLGAMIAANIITARALAPLELLIGAGRQWTVVRVALARLEEILKAPAAQPAMHLPALRGRLEFDRVIYIPPGADRPTLKGLSFRVDEGKFLGLIGPSAAGKSTLARLITGVWAARSGTVRVDGAEVQSWNRADFGRACGYLPQDVQLFNGTVRENIARFTEAGDEDIIAAAQGADAHEMILRLKDGYDTRVGLAGAALSAGQRQRIGLARALFGAPNLIVLDEPNANLDTEGEAALLHSLERARARGATLVVISHRPSILAQADLLAVLQDGELKEFGNRQDVMQRLQPQLVARKANVV